MSEEEKKAIELMEICMFGTEELTIIKNLLEKQQNKIRKIINKYVDIDEHLKYTNQELYGEDLKNMINELLEEN